MGARMGVRKADDVNNGRQLSRYGRHCFDAHTVDLVVDKGVQDNMVSPTAAVSAWKDKR